MHQADRRLVKRFEVAAGVWGHLDGAEPLWVHNIARDGLLVESRGELPVGSALKLRLTHGVAAAEARAVVRRVAALGNGDRHLVALEFVDLDEAGIALLEQMLRAADANEV